MLCESACAEKFAGRQNRVNSATIVVENRDLIMNKYGFGFDNRILVVLIGSNAICFQ